MPIKEVSQELQVSTDSLRTWLKNAGLNPNSAKSQKDSLKAAQKQLNQILLRAIIQTHQKYPAFGLTPCIII